MNRAFFVLSALSGVAAVTVVVLAVQSFRRPAVRTAGVARAEQIGALVLLALGVVAFGSSALASGGDASGPWMFPPAVLLAAMGVLASRRPDIASRLLLWGAAIVVPLTFVIALIVSASNRGRPFGATFSNAVGAVVFVVFFAVPAAITGWLLHRAAGAGASAKGTNSREAGHSAFA
ncbi:MAG: hypothetical protein ACHQNA_00310 [Acidimicrobiales bacterium]